MTDPKDPSILNEILRQIIGAQVWSTIALGAFGGATNALVTEVSLRDAIRLTVIGSLVAFGVGSLAMGLLVRLIHIQPELIPVGGVGGAGAYLIGIFGGAFIDLTLARIKKAKGQTNEGDGSSG